LLGNGICHAIATERPDLVVVVYKAGAVVWRAVEVLWRATQSGSLPPVLGVNIGRTQTSVYEDEVAAFGWGDADIGRLAAWAAEHPLLRPALAARMAPLGASDPQRILVVDDVVSTGATAFLTMGLVWGAWPRAEMRSLAGMGGMWRDRLGRAWLEEVHPGQLAELDAAFGDSDGPWHSLVSGLADFGDGSLNWQPLTVDHWAIRGLTRYLPAAEWLQFPCWVQSSLVAALQRRLAATMLAPSAIAAWCAQLRAPERLAWKPAYRLWACGWRAQRMTLAQLADLAGLEMGEVQPLLAAMVAAGDYVVVTKDGESRYVLRARLSPDAAWSV
jgi:hypothetical protein